MQGKVVEWRLDSWEMETGEEIETGESIILYVANIILNLIENQWKPHHVNISKDSEGSFSGKSPPKKD